MDVLELKVLPVKTGSSNQLTFQVDPKELFLVHGFYNDNVKSSPDHYLNLQVKKWYRKRTLGQNALWHEMLNEVAVKLGVHVSLVKEGIKESAVGYGYPSVINPITKSPSPLPSSSATTKQMAVLFNTTFAEAGEAGIDLGHFITRVEDWRKKSDKKEVSGK